MASGRFRFQGTEDDTRHVFHAATAVPRPSVVGCRDDGQRVGLETLRLEGKIEPRGGRNMGQVDAIADTPASVRGLMKLVRAGC